MINGREIMLGIAGAAALASLAMPAVAAQPLAGRASITAQAVEKFSVRSADGTMLSGEARGDPRAPEILFIHGLRQSQLSWDKQFSDPALKGFRLVRFDLRGHGDSDKPVSLDAYADADRWAEDLAAVIAGAKLRRPVLVGWSLGGYVAGGYLRKYGGSRIAGINLVDAVIKFSPELLTPLAGQFAGSASSSDLSKRTAATAEFLAACFHQQPSAAEFDRMLVVNGMTVRAANEGLNKIATTDLVPTFKAYSGPILLTHGKHDRLVRTAMSQQIKAIHPGSRLSIFDNSGHSPFYEEPRRFGRELAAFATAATQQPGRRFR